MASRSNPIYRALNRPLTILGAERKLFFVAVTMGATVFNLLNSLLGGLLVAGFLYFLARWATKTDPQILRFIFKAGRLRSQYDPAKLHTVSIRRVRHA